ncbi:alpha/beta hydrolase fold domain-containing protein [Altererythrobacter xixiisoli]|uniref:Alpha/beta hydrolase fold domain-containing protein n=1 Tax=Croceibacterium xixiisoli TaxID=1476466 RepID=A0A6I4TTJ0_9SPHN|nr:alpha/beta hydrolase [Croceibacterium xixiisoli]MXO98619.1 alpha/beta hydrolase fold domain-containing protein [Croceibacterium xixiisoli]
MANAILDQLIAGMRAGGPDFSDPPLEVRATFAALLDTMPEPDGVVFTETTLGGVPALECRADGTSDDGVLLYLHGGGYVAGSARGYRGLPAALGRAAGIRAIALDYRLAPEAPFPAPVDDVLAAYDALIDQGVPAARILLAGDSAGGGLTMATLIALRDAGKPAPGGALLLSPWVDLTGQSASWQSKADADPSLTPAGLAAAAGHYLQGQDARAPLASPLFADLSDLPPLMIQVGSSEILLDDATGLAARAGAAGTSVRLEVWPQMIHVWQAFSFMLPEGQQAIDAAGQFFRDRLAGAQ